MEHQFILHSESVKGIAVKVINSLPLDPPREIIIRNYKSKRSSSQNSLYWLWLSEIAKQIQVEDDNGNMVYLTKDDWHDLCRMKWLGKKVIKIADMSILRPEKSTTALNVSEFSEYLTKMEAHFLQKGAVLTFPDDYGLAMGVSHE